MSGVGLGSVLSGSGGSMLGSVLGLVGSLASSAMSTKEARKTRRMQWQIWQEQKDLALHAHEYEVADLRRAGLNPILSATGGSGVSVPSGSVTATPGGLDFSGAGDPVSKAFDLVAALQKMELMEKQIEGVSSANEGARLENDARKLNNHINAATAQFEINRRAYGSKKANVDLQKAAAELVRLGMESSYWNSARGRKVYSAMQEAKAYPKSGTVGTVINFLQHGMMQGSEFVRDHLFPAYGKFVDHMSRSWKR